MILAQKVCFLLPSVSSVLTDSCCIRQYCNPNIVHKSCTHGRIHCNLPSSTSTSIQDPSYRYLRIGPCSRNILLRHSSLDRGWITVGCRWLDSIASASSPSLINNCLQSYSVMEGHRWSCDRVRFARHRFLNDVLIKRTCRAI